MQWCQRLEADYGMDPQVWQSLDDPSFCLSSKLCLCNSFHGCFVPNSKKGAKCPYFGLCSSWVSCVLQIVSCILDSLSFWANIHLSVSTYYVSSFGIELPHSGWCPPGQSTEFHKFILFNSWVVLHCVSVPHFLYQFLCWGASRFFPASGYYK